MTDLTLDIVKNAVAGTAAAFRCVTEYQPAGGPGDKVFPPTYEGGKYAEEERVDPATGEVTSTPRPGDLGQGEAFWLYSFSMR